MSDIDMDFELPDAIPSEFASADSFRGRLCLIKVTGFEKDVPTGEPGKFKDRVTATVTVVDGKGPVQVFSRKQATGQFLDGPSHEGVWFNQDRIVPAIAKLGEGSVGKTKLGVFETFKAGKPAGQGNPWGLLDPTPEQIQTARDFIAGRLVGGAETKSEAAPGNDPWAAK